MYVFVYRSGYVEVRKCVYARAYRWRSGREERREGDSDGRKRVKSGRSERRGKEWSRTGWRKETWKGSVWRDNWREAGRKER